MLAVNINNRKPNQIDLDHINNIIKAAMDIWQLPERVKRMSLPLYYYQQDDLIHMQFLIAEIADVGIVGLAALEETDSIDLADDRRTMLLHGLYVAPYYHCRGIATQLVESAELCASKHGVSGLLVKAQADSAPFFNKKGFTKLLVEDFSRDYGHRYLKMI
ncbi:MAG: N-acetylglutamate synthase-like GNAT family acetyltransferase [Paraglaciecola sp.]|jgi:N-acetylglutamate synthase-like GNAT family acetyltransferase